MPIKSIKLKNFRNFNEVNLGFAPGINIITGLNGSGKTSVLESISLLSSGRSFRTSNINRLINFDTDNFLILADIEKNNNSVVSHLGCYKKKSLDKSLKLNGKPIKSVSEVASFFPICCIEGCCFRALLEPPQFRRKMLDWGVFHVKHDFFTVWKKYNSVLKQRNKLLKQGGSVTNDLNAWDITFSKVAVELAYLRYDYFIDIQACFYKYLSEILPKSLTSNLSVSNDKISIGIKHGLVSLDENEILQSLKGSLHVDIDRGFTSVGPHKADLVFKVDGVLAKDVLSRGQQKILIIIYYLAQLTIVKEFTDKNYTILIDDLAAELDNDAIAVLYSFLSKLNHQLIITSIDEKNISCMINNENIIRV